MFGNVKSLRELFEIELRYAYDAEKTLAEKGIPSMIYYPVPAHRQKMFASSGGGDYLLETTDWLTERVISLPMHTELDEEQLQTISSAVLEYVNKK